MRAASATNALDHQADIAKLQKWLGNDRISANRIIATASADQGYRQIEEILRMTSSATLTPDQLAAHCLLSELRTRIAVQPLPYQYGLEARALESLWEIFGLARKAMKDHPGCQDFSRLTTNMLNVDLRPVTAKWHRAHKSGLLDSKDGANNFRADLARLQVRLIEFSQALQLMAYGKQIPDEIASQVIGENEISHCFVPIKFGLEVAAASSIPNAAEINAAEAAEIIVRRNYYQIHRSAGIDAIGLSLSGGGIRSSTFCLGVVQVLAERGLMKDFDYLSTVSGGGYIGSFITASVGGGKDFKDIGKPYGPDTDPVRHIRQNAKYLSPGDLKQRWMMVNGTIAGLLLNWTAPLSILAILALISNHAALSFSAETWLVAAAALGISTAVSIGFYGLALRWRAGAEVGSMIFGWGTSLTLLALAGFLIERGYLLFATASSAHWSILGYIAAWIIGVSAIVRFIPMFNTPSAKKMALSGVLLAASIIVPLLALVIFYLLRVLGSLPIDSTSPLVLLHYVDGDILLIAVAVVSGLIALILDVNLTGLHKVYRDQLSKTFVQDTEETSDLPLSSVNPRHRAPYHLINATLNLPSSKNRALRDRKGDFFIFSKCWSGAAAVGYKLTADWNTGGKKMDLATAMAISGAAVSPQMGRSSIPSLSALMTLFNIRLGYWMTNFQSPGTRAPGFICLLREMTGVGMSEKSRWLNLSDGGHIENMGIYELLRRRCKFIVCVDGEVDPESTFEGQLTLVRHAQIDFGVRLEPRLDDIRLDPQSKFSRTHSHLLRIHYPATGLDRPAAIGLMLYLKLSLTGDETEILKRYRTINPDFPHQSTFDQFYDEEQFEAYRQLGVHVAEGVFSPALLTQNVNPIDIASWFRQLASNMLEPSNS